MSNDDTEILHDPVTARTFVLALNDAPLADALDVIAASEDSKVFPFGQVRGVHVRDFKLYASQTRSKETLRSRLLKKLRKRQAASSSVPCASRS
jgi:hypothetical protein